MSEAADDRLDIAWLNDRSDYQLNFVHGLRNAKGLHLQYRLDGDRVVASWLPSEDSAGFPGLVHGGLIAAILDDAMGRQSALRHRWFVTGRLETRFREPARIGEWLDVESRVVRLGRKVMRCEATIRRSADAVAVADAQGTYVAVPAPLVEQMVGSWAGFAAYTSDT